MDDICGAMVQIDCKGNITFWNASAEHVLGFTEEDVLGTNALENIFVNNNSGDKNIMQVIDTNEVYYSFESYVKNKSGDMQPVALVTSPMNNENGEIVGVTVLVSNILLI